MFPRAQRITRSVFPAQDSRAHRASSAHFLITSPYEGSGYAVVISKKVARLSVSRHRLKRRVLAALRALPQLPKSLIVFPRASATGLDFAATKEELATLLSKILK
ncbi:MAG: ribonuclease P protein component [Candidatus Paceibacterota bacterium]